MTASTHNPLTNRSDLLELMSDDGINFLDDAINQIHDQSHSSFHNHTASTTDANPPPMQSSAINCQPSDIYVLIGGSISIVDFNTYLQKTLQQEDGYGYSDIQGYVPGITEAQYKEGKKANAMAVKMFAWWCRTVYAKHKSEGAHLCNTSGCQNYQASASPTIAVISALISISDVGVRTNAGGILFSQCLSGSSWTNAGSSSTGTLLQRGSYALAKQNYSYTDILTYFYANVPSSVTAPYPAFPETISRGALTFLTNISIQLIGLQLLILIGEYVQIVLTSIMKAIHPI